MTAKSVLHTTLNLRYAESQSYQRVYIIYDAHQPLLSFVVQAGAKYFLVEFSWWVQWRNWVGHECAQTGPRPPPIDNTPLLEAGSSTKLRPFLRDEQDYIIVSSQVLSHCALSLGHLRRQVNGGRQVWEALDKKFNSPDASSGPALPRRGVREFAVWGKPARSVVEVYGVNVLVCPGLGAAYDGGAREAYSHFCGWPTSCFLLFFPGDAEQRPGRGQDERGPVEGAQHLPRRDHPRAHGADRRPLRPRGRVLFLFLCYSASRRPRCGAS